MLIRCKAKIEEPRSMKLISAKRFLYFSRLYVNKSHSGTRWIVFLER